MSQRLVVDVRLTWCGDAIAVRRFSGGQIAKLGDGPGCLAPVPVASEGDWPIARVDGSSARVVVPPKAAAVVERGAGATQRFGALAAVTLAVGDRARVIFGDFEVDVAPAWEEIVAPKGKRAFAFAPLLHFAVAAAAHAVVIVSGARSAAADDDVRQADAAYDIQRFLARADDATADEPGRGGDIDRAAGSGRAGDGERARGAQGATGSEVAQRTPDRHGINGARAPRAARRPVQGGARAPAVVRAIEPSQTRPRTESLVAAAPPARSPHGREALGARGIEEGGGGRFEGAGLGEEGALGYGASAALASASGEGSPLDLQLASAWASWDLGARSHVIGAPSMRPSTTQTDSAEGRLPPEVVQRVVRANFGRFRACYEKGLAHDPTLEGRVVTQFVVDARGAVIASSDAGSAFADRDVVACVVHAFRGLSFPREADAARVTVTYPLLLAPR